MAPGVCVASFRVFLRSSDMLRFRITPNTTQTVSRSFLNAESRPDYRGRARYCSTSQTSNSPPAQEEDCSGEVTVKYIQGLPHITVPLPSRNEKCRFALKPVSHKVFNLIEMLKLEDRGVDRAIILNDEGVRIASTCSIESLMDEPFWLYINDKKYKVVPPERERISSQDLTKLGDVRALVGQLYEALHVGEYHLHKEQELEGKLEQLKYQLSPLEERKTELSAEASRRANLMTWAGLGFMSVQFGILARLTWWEYSWDIMEPVTYFVTYGTAMAGYAYYCTTKQEYNYPEVKDRQYLLTLHKRAKKKRFDIEEYNSLKRQIADIEYDLRRLRDPLNLQLGQLEKGTNRKCPINTPPSIRGVDSSCKDDSSIPPTATNLIFTAKTPRTATEAIKELLSLTSRKKNPDQ
ncbi:calcium uniporter protein, mitochondrial [Episyrphus balteatus]|uniref:calcium uniporter protein, mitochondrial n=1 Tax=Episyrphus balteatus TaxID=286459 RepID=UPI00248525C0|nr:calcium uniporter protein, mitochondrial [Episyrphus balteatus]